MRYKIERFGDAGHLQRSQKNEHIKPHEVMERNFDTERDLVSFLKTARFEQKKGSIYRVTPMMQPFTVEIDVSVSVQATVSS
jgi:hypothetical protein